MEAACQPADLEVLRAEFWDRSVWRKSARGNWWTYVGHYQDGWPVTLFPVRRTGGDRQWKWSIGRARRAGGPIYSTVAYDDARGAHSAAWEALARLVKAAMPG